MLQYKFVTPLDLCVLSTYIRYWVQCVWNNELTPIAVFLLEKRYTLSSDDVRPEQ